MKLDEVRKKYLDFFKDKIRGHGEIESATLALKDDPTTLFTSSGMQPLLPYLLGKKEHTKGRRLVDVQRCFRAGDIEEVGDNRHTTFFEMLGNWSLGNYFKQEQLSWLFEFLTDEIGLKPEKFFITVFAGDEKNGIPKDTESVEIWKKLFAEKNIEAKEDERIFYYGAENWWSRAGAPEQMPVGEPGGSDTEVFYDFGEEIHSEEYGENCHPNCECGRFMEIGNSVFMEYVKREDGSFGPLPSKNVDFGGGLERITAASNDDNDIFNIDAISSVIKKIEEISGKSYNNENKKEFRIIADHIRASVFIIADEVIPSNTEQGYILRRLIRRAVRYADKIGIEDGNLSALVEVVVEQYSSIYKKLEDQKNVIYEEINKEEEKFRKTLEKGLKEFEKLSENNISGYDAFILFSTYGFPIEMTAELAKEKGIEVDKNGFREEMKKHQELSRKGAEQKFKGGLADTSEMSAKYHTATHLLLQALKDVLGDSIRQKGSNITAERLRLDFSWGEKLTDEEKQKVEVLVNQKIKDALPVTCEEMSMEEAKKQNIVGEFGDKYKETVRIYKIGNYSTELCGGPHIKNTSELGHFKIKKEESVSSGVRRIKAVLE